MLIFLTGSCTLRPHTKVYLVFDCTNPRFLTHVDLFLAIDSASFQGFATPSSVGRRQLSSRSNSGVPGRGPIGGPPSQAIHQSSPSSTLEPTPLGSIQLDGEMDAEASGDGSSDLLLKFGFAESFADSPERSSPRHPRQGAASDKERPHQQKQQQRELKVRLLQPLRVRKQLLLKMASPLKKMIKEKSNQVTRNQLQKKNLLKRNN